MNAQPHRITIDGQDIATTLIPPAERRRPPSPEDDYAFGSVVSDHMFVADYRAAAGGWQSPAIVPFGPFSMRPDAVAFHYGQQIFEGMKAYASASHPGRVNLFRPALNAARFARSAEKVGMVPVPPPLFLAGVKSLVAVDKAWVPPRPGALYVRPFLIPLDHGVSYRASADYRFCVLLSPAKSYFNRNDGVAVFVERDRVRAVRGGVGDAKCGGNYAGSVASLSEARRQGADQVLWLDALEFKYVEEVGAMNIMFVYEDEIVTPPLGGSILPGVTRRSVLELGPEALPLPVRERRVAIDEVLADARSGKLREAFGCGTAAVISPIRAFVDQGQTVSLRTGPDSVATRIKAVLEAIQFDDPSSCHPDWLTPVPTL